MSDIIGQQKREQDLIKEAVAKRSLQEIQQEQAFQEWWDAEAARAREEELERSRLVAAGGKGKGQGQAKKGRIGRSRGGGEAGAVASRGRGRGRAGQDPPHGRGADAPMGTL